MHWSITVTVYENLIPSIFEWLQPI
uniref:Uncharacterized protein n=1 Tax=Anguilla anguilla TaxID=7936 RepID=A0A0E9PC07_ANGAN